MPGPGRDLFVSFSSIGHDPDQLPSPEFAASLRGLGPALFVRDAARSWGNAPDFHASVQGTIARMRRDLDIDRVVMIGQSMGAYSAMVAANDVPTDIVIAFGPQARIDPDGEPRWRQWTSRLQDPAHPVCPIPAVSALWLFHGMLDDADDAVAFPAGPGITHVLFAERSHHDLCAHLKTRGVLRGLIQAIVAGERRRALRIAASAGGLRRKPV